MIKKIIYVFLALLSLFLITSCTSEKEAVSDEELRTELEKLPPAEVEKIANRSQEGSGVLAGQATARGKITVGKKKVSSQQAAQVAQKVTRYNRESQQISQISDPKVKTRLKEILESTKGEDDPQFFYKGKAVTLSGYTLEKNAYLASLEMPKVWSELKTLKKLPAPKAGIALGKQFAGQEGLSPAQGKKLALLVSTGKSDVWVPEKESTKLGTEAEDSICAKRVKGVGLTYNFESKPLCYGIYKGIPIIGIRVGEKDNYMFFSFEVGSAWSTILEHPYFYSSEGCGESPTNIEELKKCLDEKILTPEKIVEELKFHYSKNINRLNTATIIYFLHKDYLPEICDNYFDDNINGKTDCEEKICSGLITPVSFGGERLCHNGLSLYCGSKNIPEKVVDKSIYGTKMCYGNKWHDVGTVEFCDNGIDDNVNGKVDCEDPGCLGFVSLNANNQDVLCAKGEYWVCGTTKSPYGSVVRAGGFDALCYQNGKYSTWSESDVDGVSEKRSVHGSTSTMGTLITAGGCNYLSVPIGGGEYETWSGCQCKKGPDGIEAKEGKESVTGYMCNDFDWVPKEKYVAGEDDLVKINDLFKKGDYHPQGFMYRAAELYEAGSFPLLPYLTLPKSQGGRGHCWTFAEVGGAEIILKNRQDLSEQNRGFVGIKNFNQISKESGFSFGSVPLYIGLEEEWPYNPDNNCKEGKYYSELSSSSFSKLVKEIPCSPTFHQGIINPAGESVEPDDPNKYVPYEGAKNTKQGGCVIGQLLDSTLAGLSDEEKINYLGNIVNSLKYPFSFSSWDTHLYGSDINGFVDKKEPSAGGGHRLLVVGFVHKDDIPPKITTHPAFKTNEHYFIVKNSWGTGVQDGGFFYVPGSYFAKNTDFYVVYKYDVNDEVYKDCPYRASASAE